MLLVSEARPDNYVTHFIKVTSAAQGGIYVDYVEISSPEEGRDRIKRLKLIYPAQGFRLVRRHIRDEIVD